MNISAVKKKLLEIPTEQLLFQNFPAYIAVRHPGYRFSKHNKLIMKALMKVETGEIKRLIVCMPPRHGKTLTISEYFPAWYIGRNPANQIIFSTYSHNRATDVGRKVRNQMIDPMYCNVFKGCHLSADAKSANRLNTHEGGSYFAVGAGGAITGRGAHLFIIDDPIKGRKEAESDTLRRQMIEWYQGVAYTRLMPQNAIIIVQTRWHYNDLVGFVTEEMENEDWTIINLPAICEDPENDIIGRNAGEALWPTDFPIEKLEHTKTIVGTREWNAQFQQHPLPEEGGIVDLNWFRRYDYHKWLTVEIAAKMRGDIELPYDINRIVMSWDTAFKESEMSDPSACTVWGCSKDNKYYLLSTINKHMQYPKLRDTVINTWQYYSKFGTGICPVLIEDKASGQSLIQELRRNTNIPVIAINPTAAKKVRLEATTPLIEAGRVFLPERSKFLVEYETELARFPYWKFDNLVDSTSQFLSWVGAPKFKRNKKLKFWK